MCSQGRVSFSASWRFQPNSGSICTRNNVACLADVPTNFLRGDLHSAADVLAVASTVRRGTTARDLCTVGTVWKKSFRLSLPCYHTNRRGSHAAGQVVVNCHATTTSAHEQCVVIWEKPTCCTRNYVVITLERKSTRWTDHGYLIVPVCYFLFLKGRPFVRRQPWP